MDEKKPVTARPNEPDRVTKRPNPLDLNEPIVCNPEPDDVYIGPGPRGTNSGLYSFNPMKDDNFTINGEPAQGHNRER